MPRSLICIADRTYEIDGRLLCTSLCFLLCTCIQYSSFFISFHFYIGSKSDICYTPVDNGTYYDMAMSVRFSVRPSIHVSGRPSVRLSHS
jgi:hypothetical protein